MTLCRKQFCRNQRGPAVRMHGVCRAGTIPPRASQCKAGRNHGPSTLDGRSIPVPLRARKGAAPHTPASGTSRDRVTENARAEVTRDKRYRRRRSRPRTPPRATTRRSARPSDGLAQEKTTRCGRFMPGKSVESRVLETEILTSNRPRSEVSLRVGNCRLPITPSSRYPCSRHTGAFAIGLRLLPGGGYQVTSS